MINNYMEIIHDQLELMVKSSLYDECESISVGLIGSQENIKQVNSVIRSHSKINVEYHSENLRYFEFKTLGVLFNHSLKEEPFYAFYIHTKGCSFPNNKGGKVWRDYMDYYVIKRWRDNIINLDKGYDTSGVKLLSGDKPPAYLTHYSGNFWWADSNYIKTLPNIFNTKIDDRFQAEFWIGRGAPKAASLCQRHIDYGITDDFVPGKILVHTLGFNTPSEIEDATALLYDKNNENDFEHTIVDLSFPLEKGDVYPKSIEKSVSNNTKRLHDLCDRFGSGYVKLPNIGVSQNWTAITRYLNPTEHDIVIGQDPDERVYEDGWLNAMATVLRCNDKIAIVSLMIPDHEAILTPDKYKEVFIGGVRCWFIKGHLNWGLIGISGRFLNLIGEVPYPKDAPKYGWLEAELEVLLKQYELKWVILPDYKEYHTENNKIYREWKNDCVYNVKNGQIDFTDWLKKKTNG
jgi:hypothetical protein